MADEPEDEVGLLSERLGFDALLQEGAGGDGDLAAHLRALDELVVARTSPGPRDLVVDLLEFRRDGERRKIRLRIGVVIDGRVTQREFVGQYRLNGDRLQPGSFVVWEDAYRPPSRGTGDELTRLARRVGVVLALMTVAGATAWFASLRLAIDKDATLTELLLLTAAVGWTGSCGAALRTVMERYRNGFEFDGDDDDLGVRRQWPPNKHGTERFSKLIAPTCLGRPFLGLVIGPIAYFVTRSSASVVQGASPSPYPDEIALATAMAVSGLAGMFAKSIWDNLNTKAKDLFK